MKLFNIDVFLYFHEKRYLDIWLLGKTRIFFFSFKQNILVIANTLLAQLIAHHVEAVHNYVSHHLYIHVYPIFLFSLWNFNFQKIWFTKFLRLCKTNMWKPKLSLFDVPSSWALLPKVYPLTLEMSYFVSEFSHIKDFFINDNKF